MVTLVVHGDSRPQQTNQAWTVTHGDPGGSRWLMVPALRARTPACPPPPTHHTPTWLWRLDLFGYRRILLHLARDEGAQIHQQLVDRENLGTHAKAGSSEGQVSTLGGGGGAGCDLACRHLRSSVILSWW